MGMNTLTVGGVDLTATYGVYVDSSMSFDKPKKNVETVSIPGRNGDLVIDYGTFQNIVVTYPCYIRGNFDTNFNALMKKLATMSGYQQITCSNDSTHFREGIPIIQQSPTVKRINTDGYFDLAFNCKPQRFLSGQTSVNIPSASSASGALDKDNTNGLTLAPSISVKGYGTIHFQTVINAGSLIINAVTITVASNSLPVDIIINCEKMECYSGILPFITSRNNLVSFSPNTFPSVPTGATASIWIDSSNNHFSLAKINWKEWDL